MPSVSVSASVSESGLVAIEPREAVAFNLLAFEGDEKGKGVVQAEAGVLLVATDGETRGGVESGLEGVFKVRKTASPEEGLKWLTEERFALVVLDLRTPGRRPEQYAMSVREIDSEVSVIILSAGKSVKVVADQCMSVPFDAADFLEVVREQAGVTRRRRGRSEVIREMEEALAVMQQELQEKDTIASDGEASAAMVHDLRNALFSTLGYTARLIQETNQLKTDMPDKMGPIDHIAKQLEQTSNYLFHLAQTCRHNRVVGKGETFDLAEEARQVHRVLFFNSPNLVVEAEGVFAVTGDRFELHRVLQNLFKNAFESGASLVTARLGLMGDGVLLQVVDDGGGFAEEDAAVVFQRSLSSSKRNGQGLGLRICRQIMERHGGTISLASAPGQGATFSLRFPRSQ